MPKLSADNITNIKKRCLKLSRNEMSAANGLKIVMDNEAYFGYAGHDFSQNRGFYSENKELTPRDVKFKAREKLPPRVMVWLAISESGISSPYIMESGTLNGDIYLQNCLKRRLQPFLQQYHPGNDVIFWPDGATAHYKKCVQIWFNENNIKFVKQKENPPKVPQLRPIEHVWSLLKNMVYANGWTATSKQQLIRRIKEKVKELNMQVVRNMLSRVKTDIHRVGRMGINCMN